NGQTDFSTKVLSSSDWAELGNGLYSLRFSSADTNVVGDFTFTLASAKFDNFVYDEFEVEAQPEGVEVPNNPQQCLVSGSIENIAAASPTGEPLKVVVYQPSFPAKSNKLIISADPVYTFVDSQGNFSLALVRNATLIVEIKRCGIRAQITVPDAPTA